MFILKEWTFDICFLKASFSPSDCVFLSINPPTPRHSVLLVPVWLCCVSRNGGAPHYPRQKLHGLEIWWVGWELRYSYWWCQDMFIFFIHSKFGSRHFSGSCSCLLLLNNEEQRYPGETVSLCHFTTNVSTGLIFLCSLLGAQSFSYYTTREVPIFPCSWTKDSEQWKHGVGHWHWLNNLPRCSFTGKWGDILSSMFLLGIQGNKTHLLPLKIHRWLMNQLKF